MGEIFTAMRQIIKIFGNESPAGRNGTGDGAQTAEFAANGAGVGKTGLPCQKYKAKSASGTFRKAENAAVQPKSKILSWMLLSGSVWEKKQLNLTM